MKVLKVAILTLLSHTTVAESEANKDLSLLYKAIERRTQEGSPVSGSASVSASTTVPTYSTSDCDTWLENAKASDADGSGGLTPTEFYAFLRNIAAPLADFFDEKPGEYSFDDLDWTVKITHKALACQCAKLGMGNDCCTGTNAEIPISEVMSADMSDAAKEFRADICNSISVTLETGVPALEVPVTEAPVTEAPVTEAPVTEAPVTETPVTEAPVTEAPVTEAPVTDAPVTEAPVTETPVTEAPVTEAPVTEAPVTEVPVTEAPVTETPVTDAPVTEVPVTEAPVIETPVTDAPVTEVPVTDAPATEAATTEAPVVPEEERCPFCPYGLIDPDLVLPTNDNATCQQAADLSLKLRESNVLCPKLLMAQALCCAPESTTVSTAAETTSESVEGTSEDGVPTTVKSIVMDITGATIDYSSFDWSGLISGKNEGMSEFFNAQDIIDNVDGNDILGDVIKGFGRLSNFILADMNDNRGLRKQRRLADLKPVMVTDIACPADLKYAPEDAYCLNFHFEVDPESMSAEQVADLTNTLTRLVDRVGTLYNVILEDSPNTHLTGIGSPGEGIDYLAELAPLRIVSAEGSGTESAEEKTGLGSAGIIFIVIAVIALPMALIAMFSRYKKVENLKRLERLSAINATPDLESGVPREVSGRDDTADRAKVEKLIKETNAPKTADEMLKSYAGREDELIANLEKMKAMQEAKGDEQTSAATLGEIRAEVETLCAETKSPKTADELLVSFKGREMDLLKNLREMKSKQNKVKEKMHAEVEGLVKDTNSPKTADELLTTYAGREEELIKNLKRMKSKMAVTEAVAPADDKADVKAEIRTLVDATNPGKRADDMLASYEGREEDLLKNLRKMKAKQDKAAAKKHAKSEAATAALAVQSTNKTESVREQVESLVLTTNPGKSATDLLAAYEGREEELIAHLEKLKTSASTNPV